MFELPDGIFSVVSRLAPLAFVTFAPLVAVNAGLNGSAVQLLTWNGELAETVELSLLPGTNPVTELIVLSAAQLVGFDMKPCLLTVTVILRILIGTPLTIRGSVVPTITCPVYCWTLIVARVTTVPRLKGPATAGTAIERPNGALL